MSELQFDVFMDESTDDTTTTGTVRGRVSDSGGSPLPSATVKVESDDGAFRSTATPNTFGDVSVANVPVKPGTVTITASGYETVTIDYDESDFGGSTIVRGQ